jgi:hypothetical protein
VLVAVDHCLLWAAEMEALLAVLAARTGLASEQFVVAFSHTHAAGLMGHERRNLPGGELIAPYLEALAEKSAAMVAEARRTAAPATLVYGTGRCALAGQRDLWDAHSGQFVCGFNPDGPADDTVLVVRATDAAGKTLATIVNYACHPTTLAWQNTLISPDFPGAMREVIEQATAAPCLFFQGASGDLGPREGFLADPAVADRNGRQLGHAALAALEALPPPGTRYRYSGPVVSGATLGTWEHVPLDTDALRRKRLWRCRRWTVDLPYRPDRRTAAQTEADLARWQADESAACRTGDAARARDCRAMVERMTRWRTRLASLPEGPTLPLPVTLWQLGDGLWLAVEGEHYQALQRALRERFPRLPIVVATLANGSRPAYLPAAETYGKGIYQESIAVLALGCLEQLIEAIVKQVEQWASGPRS